MPREFKTVGSTPSLNVNLYVTSYLVVWPFVVLPTEFFVSLWRTVLKVVKSLSLES